MASQVCHFELIFSLYNMEHKTLNQEGGIIIVALCIYKKKRRSQYSTSLNILFNNIQASFKSQHVSSHTGRRQQLW